MCTRIPVEVAQPTLQSLSWLIRTKLYVSTTHLHTTYLQGVGCWCVCVMWFKTYVWIWSCIWSNERPTHPPSIIHAYFTSDIYSKGAKSDFWYQILFNRCLESLGLAWNFFGGQTWELQTLWISRSPGCQVLCHIL